MEAHGGVARRGIVRGQQEAPGHAKIHDQDRAIREACNDIFSTSVDGLENPI